MIPLRDNILSERRPVVTYAMIALCVLAFLAQLMEAPGDGSLVERFGMIPARVTHPGELITVPHERLIPVSRTSYRQVIEQVPLAPSGVPAWLTLVTCIFLHGGWMHLLGNMWFLYIFGDNVEDRLGRVRFALFYVGAGVLASLTHLLSSPDSVIPTIGASGAIAGVMGAYLVLYPHAQVLTLIPFIIIQMIVVPAPLFLGLWFVMQLVQGTYSIGAVQSAGVAWWAHVGGFVAGVGIALWLRHHTPPPPRVDFRSPGERTFARQRPPRRF